MPIEFEKTLAEYLRGQTGQEQTWWALPKIVDQPAEKIEITPDIIKTSPEIQESKIKDIWDSFYVATKSLVQRGKDFFLSALPNMVFKAVKAGDPIIPKIGIFPAIGVTGFPSPLKYTEETAKIRNESTQQTKDWFDEKYQASQQKFQDWLIKNPQLMPRAEYQTNIIDAIKQGSPVLKDPGYYGSMMAEAIPFTVGVMGTTLAVGYATKNPMLAITAGMAVATPVVSQDLYEDLIRNGASKEQAADLTKIMGPAISAVEVISDIPILNQLGVGVFKNIFRKEATKAVARLTVGKLLKKGIVSFAKIEVIETIEEIVQEGLQNATVRTVNKTRGIFDDIPEVALRTLISTVPMAALGLGKPKQVSQAFQQIQQELVQELQTRGYSPEDAKAIALAGGYIGGLPGKKPEVKPAIPKELEPLAREIKEAGFDVEVISVKDAKFKQMMERMEGGRKAKRPLIGPAVGMQDVILNTKENKIYLVKENISPTKKFTPTIRHEQGHKVFAGLSDEKINEYIKIAEKDKYSYAQEGRFPGPKEYPSEIFAEEYAYLLEDSKNIKRMVEGSPEKAKFFESIMPKAVKGVKEVKPEIIEEIPAELRAEAEAIRTAGEKKLFTDIKELGGIKTDPTLKEEMSDLPIDIIRTTGVTPDEMMEMLNERGYNLDSVSDLFDSIRDIRSMPSRYKPAETTLERNLKAFEVMKKMPITSAEAKKIAELEKTARRLIREAKIPGIPTKPTIRKVTGLAPEERIIKMKESKLLREKFRNIARGAREGTISTKKEIRAVQTELLDILDRSELELKDKAKFRRTIKNIQTVEQLTRALPEFQDRIESLVEASEIRTLKTQIKKELKGTEAKLQAGKPVGRFTADVQRVLDLARTAVKLTQEEAEIKIDENLEKYKLAAMPAEVALQNRILDMSSQNVESLEELLNTVREIKNTGKMTAALKKFNVQEEYDRKKNYLTDIVTDYKGIIKGRETIGRIRMTWRRRMKQRLMGLGQGFVLSWRGLLDVLDWHTAVDKKTLADKFSVLEQENKYKELQETYINDFNDMFAEVYKIPNQTTKDKLMLPLRVGQKISDLKKEINLGEFKNTVGIKIEIKITKDEMVKRYMEFQDESLEQSFREGNYYTEEIKDAIRAKLTDQEIALANGQIAFYRKQYDKINPLYQEMFGVNLPFNEFYSPIMREGYKLDTKQGFEVLLDEVFYRRAVTSKSFIKRVRNILPIARQGSLQALDRHMTDTNYFLAWAKEIRELDNIFSDAIVRESINQEFGSKLLRQIQETIDDFGYNRRIRGQLHSSVDWFRKKFTIGVLMLKPALAAKQMVSTIAYLEKLRPIEFTTGVVDFWRNPVKHYNILAKESTYIRTRGKRGEIERDIKAAMQSDIYKRFKKLPNFVNIGMTNIKFGDKAAIITGSWAMRRARLRKGIGISETIKEYEEFSSETQQSADISQLSAFQKGGSLEMVFSIFKSAPRQYFAKELNAVKTLFQKGGISPKNIRKVAKTLFIYHTLIPVFFQWITNFGGWDDEDKKEYLRAALLGSLNGLFIFGDAVEWALRKALGIRVWDIQIPITQAIQDVGTMISKIDIDDITSEDMLDALKELVNASENFGIPAKYLMNIPKGIESLLEQDWREGIGLILGWSEYMLGMKRKKPLIPGLPKLPELPKLPKLPELPKLPKLQSSKAEGTNLGQIDEIINRIKAEV